MLNITITSLTLLSLNGISPLISSQFANMNMKNSYFTRSISPIFYLHTYSHLFLDNIRFDKFSNAPLHIANADYHNKSFTNHTTFLNDPSVVLLKCLFLNCNSPNENGGGILMESDAENSILSINCSGFANCTAVSGGAIYCKVRNINFSRTCFYNCFSSEGNGEVLYLETNAEIDMNYIQINSDLPITSEQSRLVNSKASLKNIYDTLNISKSQFKTGLSLFSHITEVSYLSVSNSTCDSILQVENTALLIQFSDFQDLSKSNFIVSSENSLILVVDSLFLNVSIRGFIDEANHTNQMIQFKNVYTDNLTRFTLTAEIKELPENYTNSHQIQLNTDYCWLGQATWDVSNIKFKFSGASISFIIICFFVFCIYIYLKNKITQPLTEEAFNPKSRRKSSDWNEIDAPEEEEILVINEENPEEEEKKDQIETLNESDDGEIVLDDIKVEQTAAKPKPDQQKNNIYS